MKKNFFDFITPDTETEIFAETKKIDENDDIVHVGDVVTMLHPDGEIIGLVTTGLVSIVRDELVSIITSESLVVVVNEFGDSYSMGNYDVCVIGRKFKFKG